MTEDRHSQAQNAFAEGKFDAAASLFAELLALKESSDLWNDWATTQIRCNEPHEAEAGYRRALELNGDHKASALNLGILLAERGEWAEALPLLERSQGHFDRPEFELLFAEARAEAAKEPSAAVMEDYLRKWQGADSHGQEYFATHLGRYMATLQMLPQATTGQKLLELGSSFHQLTPALAELKGYEVFGADIWDGDRQQHRRVRSSDGSVFICTVSNFDLESAPWPYPDGAFDVVLMCEILEHLARDPMLVMSELNRVLRPEGFLLLTTPNIASAKSIAYALLGKSPYVFGQYVPGGLATDRHNREYTAIEAAALVQEAGFDLLRLRTQDSWWKTEGHILAKLPTMGMPIALRGDNTLLLARKSGAIRNRYPEEFYCSEGSQAERRKTQQKPRAVLIVHDVLPHFDRSGSDVRLLQIIETLRRAGNRVTIVGRSSANRERYQPQLESLGVTVYSGDPDRMGTYGIDEKPPWNFERLLKQKFDCAILFHWFWSGISTSEHYLNIIRRCSPATRIAILTDDRHGLRERRMAELTGLLADRERSAGFHAREAEIYSRADLLLGISEDDLADLRVLASGVECALLPMAAPGGRQRSPFQERRNVVFLANFDNLANRDGIEWFLREIWPMVHRAQSAIELHLIGNNIPQINSPGVVLCGFAEEVDQALSAYRVFVCPIRFGTGIKTKNLSAMANGLPIITTTVGAEGMGLATGQTALVCDSPQAFAGAILELHANEELWNTIAQNALRHLETTFSESHLESRLQEALEILDRVVPKAYDPDLVPSVLLVERRFPDLVTQNPPESRIWLRILAYVKLAERLIESGEFSEGLAQLRHVFAFVRGEIPRTLFFGHVLDLMARSYRSLGQETEAAACERECRLCLPDLQLPHFAHKRSGKARQRPEISVIVPTYNRQQKLGRCLAALDAQSLPGGCFEVIVIDDGSDDDTGKHVRSLKTRYSLRYLRQANAGAGAARRAGVEHAKGNYLVFINDDTLMDTQALFEHLRIQKSSPKEQIALLGNFRYPADAKRRALTEFLSRREFMFPQVGMHAGNFYNFNYFITCNLSVRRDLVLAAGSFDRDFRVGEDTDLGFRLESQAGVRILYHPGADAFHDHLDIEMASLVKRGKAYGPAYLRLFRKYPSFLSAIQLPVKLEQLDQNALLLIREYLQAERTQIEEVVKALAQYDLLDFELLSGRYIGDRPAKAVILDIYANAIPAVHWFHVLEGLADALELDLAAAPVSSPSFASAVILPAENHGMAEAR